MDDIGYKTTTHMSTDPAATGVLKNSMQMKTVSTSFYPGAQTAAKKCKLMNWFNE